MESLGGVGRAACQEGEGRDRAHQRRCLERLGRGLISVAEEGPC